MGFVDSLSYYRESLFMVTGIYCFSMILMCIYKNLSYRYYMGVINRVICRILVLLPVAIMAANRSYSTGADTSNYWDSYILLRNGSLLDAIEQSTSGDVLYRSLSWVICRLTGGDVKIYFFVVAALTLYFVILTIDCWKLNYSATALFVFLFCFGPNLTNQMRELLAVSIMLYAYWYIFQHKRDIFIVLSVIACLIHLSALPAAIIVYCIVFIGNDESKGSKFYLILLIATVFCQPIAQLLGRVLFYYTKYYSKYFLESSETSLGMGMLLTLIPIVIPAFILHYRLDQEGKILKIISVTIPARLVGYDYYFVSRMHYYFSSMGVVGLPLALENVSDDNRPFVRCFIIIMILVYYLTFYFWKDAATYFPYVFIS